MTQSLIAQQKYAFARQELRKHLHDEMDPMLELRRLKGIQSKLLETRIIEDEEGNKEEVMVRFSKEELAQMKLASDNAKWIIGKIMPTPQAIDISGGESFEDLLDKMSDEERLAIGASLGVEQIEYIEGELVDDDDDFDPLA